MRKLVVLSVCLLTLFVLPPVSATVYYVDGDGGSDTSNNGTGWLDSFATVQHAIDTASSGDEVWVRARDNDGGYNEAIEMKPGVSIYGGFGGGEDALSERNVRAHVTTLDGTNLNSSVVTVWVWATGDSCNIDGFTIKNGSTAGTGGGIRCEADYSRGGGSPTIRNNIIANNTAGCGGGIYSTVMFANPLIENNTIRDNVATGEGGGGLQVSQAEVRGNTITGNSANSGAAWTCGGGILVGADTYLSALIHDNTISGNTAKCGGGIYGYTSVQDITGNTIEDNTAEWCGGGIYLDDGCEGTVCRNVITGNEAAGQGQDIGDGGGIYSLSNCVPITNNIIAQNTAVDHGGGLWASCIPSSCVTISNNTIASNGAADGGGVYFDYYCDDVPFASNIVTGNSSGIYVYGGAPALSHNDVLNTPGYDYYGVSASIDDISADPGFGSNYHITVDSPCINAGDDAYAGSGDVDIDDEPRCCGAHVDMGADEYTFTVTIEQADGQDDPTDSTPINFTVVFSDPATDFDDADDVSITGTCGGLKTVTITQTDTEGMQYNVAVSNLTVGTVIAAVPAGKAVNSSGIWNCESASSDAEVTYQITDSTPPTTPNVIDDGETIAYPVPPVTTNSLHASWTSEDPESGVSLYDYRIREINGTQETTIYGPTTTSSSDITVSNLSLVPGRTYYFGVKAQNGAGLWSDEGWSDGITCKQVIYVKRNSPNTPDGLTWASAYHSIGAALNGSVAGKEIWVAGGFTYVDNITIPSGAGVFGKFLGTESIRPVTRLGDETIIDGNSVGTVVKFPTGAGSNTVIDGFTIQKGSGDYYPSPISSYLGGGIYCADDSYPTVSNNTIKSNTADKGGAIYCRNSDPLIYGNLISSNKGYDGAGIYLYNSSSWIDSNTISGGLPPIGTSSNGGGIYCTGGAPTITNNSITGNKMSGHGSGIYCANSSPWIFGNPAISDNVALSTTVSCCGGGIYLSGCFDVYISDNTISGNQLPYIGKGAGIYVAGTSGQIESNNIYSNHGTDSPPYGGGIYCSGDLSSTSDLVIYGNVLSSNQARSGGGIMLTSTRVRVEANLISGNSGLASGGGINLDNCSAPIVNNMIVGNSSTYYTSSVGGGIHCSNGTTSTVRNNTLVNNTAQYNGGGISCSGTGSAPVITSNIIAYSASGGGFYQGNLSNPTHDHNCIVLNTSYDYSPLLTRGSTDIQAGIAPGFIEYSGGDFHLAYGSPCIDTGSSTGAPTTDYDNDTRDANVDIGADEYVSN